MPRTVRSNRLPYTLLTKMTSLNGNVYSSHDYLYAWYQFDVDVSLSGDLSDLSGNSRDLQPETSADRIQAPTDENPSGPRAPTGFPTKSALFNDDVLVDKSGTTSAFSWGVASSDDDSPFSVSAWIKSDAADPSSVRQIIAAKWKTSGSKREWQLEIVNGTPMLQLTSAGITGNSISVKSAVEIQSDTWYHIVGTYDGSAGAAGLAIYVNGDATVEERTTTGTYDGMTGSTDARFTIGNSDPVVSESTTHDLQAEVSQVAVWSSELTEEEAIALYELKDGIAKTQSGYLNIPPRLKIREQDSATGSYPTAVRTGDRDRQGIHNTHFNDNHTVTFGKTIKDGFSLKKKYNLLGVGLLPFSKVIDTNKWTTSPHTQIRQEIGVNEGGQTSRDGALVLYGESDGTGRWIQTKDKIVSPDIRFDVIVGPYNLGYQHGTLNAGLNLGNPNILEVLKIQYSTDGSTYHTIMELSPFLLFNFFGDRNKVRIPELGFTEHSRKRAKVTLGIEDFSEAKGQPFYFRILQDVINDPTVPVWAIGDIRIDSRGTEDLSYPMLLPKNTFIAEEGYKHIVAKPHRSGTIEARGRSVAGVSDLNFEFTPGESISPFNEESVIVDPESIFYRQGTDPEVTPGFSSPVFSKTIIEIPINNAEPTTFGFNTIDANVLGGNVMSSSAVGQCYKNLTGSDYRNKVMAYFNFKHDRWEKIAKGYGPNLFSGSGDMTNTAAATQHLTGTYIPDAAIGFGPIGPISEGTDVTDLSDQKLVDARILNTYARPIEQFGFPLAPKYHATGSCVIKAKDLGIHSPFVLEKVVIDFNAKIQNAAATVTAMSSVQDADNAQQHQLAFSPAVSAPATIGGVSNPSHWSSHPLGQTLRMQIPTFFLLRQFNGRRTVQVRTKYANNASGQAPSTENYDTNAQWTTPGFYNTTFTGSAIERGDGKNTESRYANTDRDLITYGQMTVIYSGSRSTNPASDENWNIPFEDILATPLVRDGKLILPTSNQSYTGSLRLEFSCKHSSRYPDIVPMKVYTTKYLHSPRVDDYHTSEMGNLMLGSQTFGGRSLGRLQSSARALARGYASKDTTADTIIYISSSSLEDPLEYSGATLGLPELGTFEQVSPYVILPEDDLVVGFQYPISAEPAMTQATLGDTHKYAMELFGSGKVSLIGSLIKEGKEFHETMNQNLTSDAVHEIIGAEAIKDQFRISERSELEGTFLDDLIMRITEKPIERVGAAVESANTLLGKGKVLALTTFIFENKSFAGQKPDGFRNRIDFGSTKYQLHGDVIQIPKSNTEQDSALFESVLAPGFPAGTGRDGDGSGTARIPFWGGDVLDGLVDLIFPNDSHQPSYHHAFWLYLSMLSQEAQNQGIYGLVPPIPVPPYTSHSSNGLTFFIIGVVADESIDGQQVKVISQGTRYADLDGDGHTFLGLGGEVDGDGVPVIAGITGSYTDDNMDKFNPENDGGTAGSGTTGSIASFSEHGFMATPFTPLGVALRGSVERFMTGVDSKRVFIDSLRGSGSFMAPDMSIGTMQTYHQLGGPTAKSPKYYFDSRRYGQFSDFVEPGKDGRTITFDRTDRNVGNSLGPAVRTIFVSGSTSDDMLIKQYERISRNNATLSQNKTLFSKIDKFYHATGPQNTDGDGPYGNSLEEDDE